MLFTREDLGCSKLAVVKRLLQEVRPDDKVVGALSLVEEHLPNNPTHDSVGTHFAGFDLEDDDEDWPEAPCEGRPLTSFVHGLTRPPSCLAASIRFGLECWRMRWPQPLEAHFSTQESKD